MPKKIEVMDGNTAAAYISYAFTEVAGMYPITPSSPIAEYVDEWAAKGKKNIFGQTVDIVELQSEGGAAGTVHGALAAGALTTTYTASQGLLLMIPNMYKIAGELLPGVFHVAARSLSIHGASIFADHADVMACRQTGFALFASSNPQEVMDLGAVAHLSAIRGRIPFLHFFDGFRTSHEIQKIDALDYNDLKPLIDMEALNKFRRNALSPEHPCTRGTTINPDIYFQGREVANKFYSRLPSIVESYMNDINKLTNRDYKLFEYYGSDDARNIIVAMGSVTETIKETIDYMIKNGEKVGLVSVHLYRPFSLDHFFRILPKSAKRIAVLSRTKEPGALGEPLYQDVSVAFQGKKNPPMIIGGRYGLSSKDTTPAQIISVYENLASDNPKDNFTIGINDDVTFLSLPKKEEIDISPEGSVSCKIWGLGSDGTVGANKNSIKIIGENTDLYAQAYFVYDSKKSGGLTQSHLRFGKNPIRSTYLVMNADFIACHNPSYVNKYDIIRDLKPGGTFLLNSPWSAEELNENIPDYMKKAMAEKHIQFYMIDAIGIAKELGLGGRTNTVLQAAFFDLLKVIPTSSAVKFMKDTNKKTYGKKGKEVLKMNDLAVDRGISEVKRIEIPSTWLNLSIDKPESNNLPDFIKNVAITMNRQEGDSLPVSTFLGMEDGTFPAGTTAYEKRGSAVDVPKWDITKCIQCNQCSYVCPHAAIRPFLLDEEEVVNAPENFLTKSASGKGLEKYQYRIQISPLDCTGCGVCVTTCPSKDKSLELQPLASQLPENENWTYAIEQVSIKKDAFNNGTVKNSQFAQPLFEFSGACAGCGETPYIKLATQLFGDRMFISNASGCSSAYGGSTPSTPYTMNKEGRGPAWAMSLFEDNAEYAYGILLGSEKIREKLAENILKLSSNSAIKEEALQWLENMASHEKSREVSDKLLEKIKIYSAKNSKEKEQIDFIIENKNYLNKKSHWAFGGDGWAYDIGFGGLDHVLASGRDINMLVLDTEVYSNTGGQASKATPTSAIAKFASSGKKTKKKDLGMMAMSYGYVYVAQIAMGYDQVQTLKAFREAEAYPGPSLIIAYSPCIEHGIKAGMSCSQLEMKKAVEAGYWHLYRYNPLLKSENKNPFVLDSKEPTADLREFLLGEVRYASLQISFPEVAEEFLNKAVSDAKERTETYLKLAK